MIVKNPIPQIMYHIIPKVLKKVDPFSKVVMNAYSTKKLKPCCSTVSKTLKAIKMVIAR